MRWHHVASPLYKSLHLQGHHTLSCDWSSWQLVKLWIKALVKIKVIFCQSWSFYKATVPYICIHDYVRLCICLHGYEYKRDFFTSLLRCVQCLWMCLVCSVVRRRVRKQGGNQHLKEIQDTVCLTPPTLRHGSYICTDWWFSSDCVRVNTNVFVVWGRVRMTLHHSRTCCVFSLQLCMMLFSLPFCLQQKILPFSWCKWLAKKTPHTLPWGNTAERDIAVGIVSTAIDYYLVTWGSTKKSVYHGCMFDWLHTQSQSQKIHNLRNHTEPLTSLRQPMKLLLTGDPGRSAVLGLPPM